MPARHDILCGALDFLWRPWGSIETLGGRHHRAAARAPASPPCWSPTIRTCSRPAARTTTSTSPPGTTSAATRATPGRPGPTPAGSARRRSAAAGCPTTTVARLVPRRGRLPGPAHDGGRGALARRERRRTTTRFFLFVDEFDPHEPFDTPEPWASMYDPDWEGAHLIWPPYAVGAVAARRADRARRRGRSARHYGAKLTMIDHWFGRLLDALDAQRAVGRHGGHRLHRPRPLPRREGHLGQARRADLRAARPHPAAGRRAGRRAGRSAMR